jgi:Zn-dependent M28 family amino/carboxypeptidase
MKKIALLAFSFAISLQVNAQNIDKIITKPYVDNLIKTLSSDDMQGRGTFTPGIDKAATFIEKEFKSIGLKFLDGQKTYRQSFNKIKVSTKQRTIIVDGTEIPASNLFSISEVEKINFNESNATIVKLDTGKTFNSQARTFMRPSKNQVILVDEKFKNEFARFKAHFDEGSVLDEKDLAKANPNASVFVLASNKAGSTFSVNIENTQEKMPLFNVAGIIPGKSKAKEIVVFSGHYDHLGITKPVEGDSIANGADDDASGTSAVIALAKYYKALNNNERTLIFVAFTAEEIGGFGSKYFSEQLNPEDVIAMFNIEMIGKDSKFGPNTAFITGYEKSDFGKILQKNLQGSKFTFHPDPYTEQNLFYRSDNATLAALGVPAHTISTDQIDIDKFYHTVKDEYSTLNVDNILSTIKAIAISATSIINGKDTPSRIPKLKQ